MPTTVDVTSSSAPEPPRRPGATHQDGHPQDEERGLPRHARGQRTHHVARAIGLVATGALAFTGVAAAAVYVDLKSQIEVSDASSYVVGGPVAAAPAEKPKDPDDPFAGDALNILVMGTDYRDEENAKIAGHEEGMRSDTTFIVHVSGDRTRMEVVSIPRDSLVDLPSCTLPDGSMSAPRYGEMFNAAFEIGSGGVDDLDHAAACTITAVQDLTGIPITNHVVVKMTGVIGVVDALDGVRMCFAEDVVGGPHSPGLSIPAGERTIDGDTAIDYVRARDGHGLGLEVGSDLTRIERQQGFIDSMVRQVLAKNVITNSPQLYRTIKAALSSVSADESLADPAALAGLAYSLRGIDPAEVVFTELPVVDSPREQYRVEWTSAADEIWARLAADEPPPGHEETTEPGDDASELVTGDETPSPGSDDAPADDAAGADDGAGSGDKASDGAGDDGSDDAAPPEEELLPGVCPPGS
ncbi:LCP family protein [Cellulosimicrobium arenosum]|uniref:LCP family protein n=1 Tax=Cellulosimicrobium arenosum TaxID=2708133 RepID=UPI0030CA2380